jgi:hypothetical protein
LEGCVAGIDAYNAEVNVTNGGSLIRGRAHRSDGSAVADARVFFSVSPVAVPDVALLTDDQGRFTLFAPAPGHYELACHAEGLEPATVSLDILAGQEEVQVDIELTAGAD